MTGRKISEIRGGKKIVTDKKAAGLRLNQHPVWYSGARWLVLIETYSCLTLSGFPDSKISEKLCISGS